jgi:hypothetical protein
MSAALSDVHAHSRYLRTSRPSHSRDFAEEVRHDGKADCPTKRVPADRFEVLLWDHLRKLCKNQALLMKLLSAHKDKHAGVDSLVLAQMGQKKGRAKRRSAALRCRDGFG